jgi:CheY-like chemotaxis protein
VTKTVKILVVRAEGIRLKLESSCLDRGSFSIRAAGSAQDALAVGAFQRPSLVIVGSDLPDATPEELCRLWRAAPEMGEARFLLVADGQRPDAAEAFLAAGGDAFIPHSTPADLVANAVASLLGVRLRATLRVPVQVLCRLDILDANSNVAGTMLASTMDVSSSGACVECQHPLRLGDVVALHCTLPGTSCRVSARSVVCREVDEVWMHYAVEFQDLPADQRDALDAFIRRWTAP